VWLERPSEPTKLLDPEGPERRAPLTASASPTSTTTPRVSACASTTRPRTATVIRTSYAYDPETFRLTHLYTRRGVDPATEHGVSFTEDCENPDTPPPDTIAASRNAACGQSLRTSEPALHLRPRLATSPTSRTMRSRRSTSAISASSRATITPTTPIYRLIQASGREHLGQLANVDPSHRRRPMPSMIFTPGKTIRTCLKP
jgi:hypothetical protein